MSRQSRARRVEQRLASMRHRMDTPAGPAMEARRRIGAVIGIDPDEILCGDVGATERAPWGSYDPAAEMRRMQRAYRTGTLGPLRIPGLPAPTLPAALYEPPPGGWGDYEAP